MFRAALRGMRPRPPTLPSPVFFKRTFSSHGFMHRFLWGRNPAPDKAVFYRRLYWHGYLMTFFYLFALSDRGSIWALPILCLPWPGFWFVIGRELSRAKS